MSFLAWIDFDEADRQRARRIMALFNESVARDELGMGSILGAIGDHLFPGVTTIHTRLRYVFFVPWLFKDIQRHGNGAESFEREKRERYVALVDALEAGGEQTGVIGRFARSRLQTSPGSIYWGALRAWGIRRFDSLPVDSRLDSLGGWAPNLPSPPSGWLNRTTFDLTEEEAGFLVDRLVNSNPRCLLTHLAKTASTDHCTYIWEHPAVKSFPERARTIVEHARVFSEVIFGASLLYNLLLSELCERREWIDLYEGKIKHWASDILDRNAARQWSLDDFWCTIGHPNHRIRVTTRSFVANWRDLAVQYGADVASRDTKEARQLVMDRERALKRAKSRIDNKSARDRWQGSSGAYRLDFRWRVAGSHIRDIANASA